jgi:hypothetical protein
MTITVIRLSVDNIYGNYLKLKGALFLKKVLIAFVLIFLLATPTFASNINNELWFGLGKISNDNDSHDNSFTLAGHGERFGMGFGGIIDKNFGFDFLYFLPSKYNFKFYLGAGLYYENNTHDYLDSKLIFSPSVGVRFYPFGSLSIGTEYHKERGTSLLIGYGFRQNTI